MMERAGGVGRSGCVKVEVRQRRMKPGVFFEEVDMSLEDNRDLSACGEECASRSVDKAYDTRLMMGSWQRTEMLSETWHQLLGSYSVDTLVRGERGEKGEEVAPPVAPKDPSMLANDPWSELLHNQGVKMVDLSGLASAHVSLSEVEVEQALQIMWEQVVEESGQG